MSMIEMKVKVVGLDQVSMLPVVILTDPEERGFIPLVIGPAEASSINMALEKVKSPRPMTHDLMLSLLKGIDTVVEKIVIADLIDDVFFAEIFIKRGTEEIRIDARPSDSIALALRCNAKIFVSESVAAKALVGQPIEDQEMEDFRRFLEQVSPDDFKKSN